jgi:hypothetical protein
LASALRAFAVAASDAFSQRAASDRALHRARERQQLWGGLVLLHGVAAGAGFRHDGSLNGYRHRRGCSGRQQAKSSEHCTRSSSKRSGQQRRCNKRRG